MVTYRRLPVKQGWVRMEEKQSGGYDMAKRLIAYYSRADENYVGGEIKKLEVGNTEIAAEMLAGITGGDLFKIEQAKPYSKDYNKCIAEAQEDQRRGARPELLTYPESIAEYDVIYLGYPNYWSTMPMAVFTFLEHFDFGGKIIKPFCTHEGSGLGSSENDIRRLCSTAEVEKGLAIRGGSVRAARAELSKWADR